MALYHTHRPQTFANIIGQSHIVRTLQNQVKTNKVAHAYLFSGGRGIGKTTSARILAKAMNCTERKDGESEPCNRCSSCENIATGRSIDVIEMDAASHTGVDNVRENIIENSQFRPVSSRYKVFIIDEVHMLSTSAFNALLKTLEEPPNYVVFILATTEKHKLPDTVISRCQRFEFESIPYSDLHAHIKSIAKEERSTVSDEIIDRIINKSEGCARDAVSILDQLLATGEKDITDELASVVLPSSNISMLIEFITSVVNRDMKTSMDNLNKLINSNTNIVSLAKEIIEILRIILVIKANPEKTPRGIVISDDNISLMRDLTSQISLHQLIKLIDLFVRRSREINSSPLVELPLELAVVEWCDHDTDSTDIKTNNEDRATVTQDTKNSGGYSPTKTKIKKSISEVINKIKVLTEETNDGQINKQRIITNTKEISFDQVQSKWQEFIQKFGATSMSMMIIFNNARLVGLKNNKITIGVPYQFHIDTLNVTTTKKQMENIWCDILSQSVYLSFTLDENSIPEIDKDILDIANEIGGVVI